MEISRTDISGTELQEFNVEDRFIKLPIDKYMSLLGITPVPPQVALINAIQNPLYRFITAVLARRTGKSLISNIIGHLITLIPGANILVIAPNYSLSAVSWDIQRKLIKTFEIEVTKSNAKDKIIELANGSTIRVGSVSQVDSVVGRSYDLIIFDECALNNDGESAFNIQLRPTLDKPNAKCIFISTPRGKNWFYDFYKRGFSDEFPTWASIHSTFEDNPRSNPEDVADAKQSMSDAEFSQEYKGEFNAMQGQIWTLKKENIVEVDLNKLEILDVLAGLDMGFRDPTAMVIIATDGTDYYIVAEYLKKEEATSRYASAIQEKIDEWNIDFIYIDSAAAQTRYDLAYDYDITCTNAKKSVLDGIGYVSSIIEHDRLYVDESCTEVINCLDNYVWDAREGLLNERPLHNEHSHIADAIRYALYTHSYNVDPIGN